MPAVTAAALAVGAGVGLVAQARRHRIVTAGHPDDRSLTTASGNTLSYRCSGPTDTTGPVLVFENGLVAGAEHWEWISQRLSGTFRTVTYHRAGYGPSIYRDNGDYDLQIAVRDLGDLLDAVAEDQPVVLVGHSLGGYLALRAAAQGHGRVIGAALVDSSHPGELQRSQRQAQGQQAMTDTLKTMPVSLRLGLGLLLPRPGYVDRLPVHVRRVALAQYRDSRMWRAGQREWQAAAREFHAFNGRLPEIDIPLLVISAEHTVTREPLQGDLHDELAAAAPRAERHIIRGADHDQVLTSRPHAEQVAGLITDFVANLRHLPRRGPEPR